MNPPILSRGVSTLFCSRWRRVLAFSLFLMCGGFVGHAQTVADVQQALVIRNAGKVEVVAKDGKVREAYLTEPIPASIPTSKGPKVPVKAPEPSAAVNAFVFAGETVRTGKDGAADIALAGGGTARLEADSMLKLPARKEREPVPESLEVLKGTLFFNIDADALRKRGKQEFRLKTPAAILAVKGTKFFVQTLGVSEVIGVHQGVVSAEDPISRQTQSIGEKQTVEASRGKLSQLGALTEQQVAMGANYSELDLARVSHAYEWVPFIAAPRPFTGRKNENLTVDSPLIRKGGVIKDNAQWKYARDPAIESRGAVVGVLLRISLDDAAMKRHPIALEFSVNATGVDALKVVPLGKTLGRETDPPFSAKVTSNTTYDVKYGEQPYWSILEGVQTKTFVPSEMGAVVPVTAQGTARVLVPVTAGMITGTKGFRCLVFTYPNEPKFARSGVELGFAIGDATLIVKK